jgi:hypothetical protein
MSRPIVRVALSTLIALALLVGIYTSVQGALLNRDQAQPAGISHGLDRNRPTIDGQNSSEQLPADAPKQGEGGGCDHEAQIDPYD